MDDADAKLIWDYMLMHHELKPADAIFGLGTNDTRVAERAAELYLQGLAPRVIFSGGNGKGSIFDRPEAEVFAEVAIKLGVPAESILMETKAANTGQNIMFTKALLKENGIQANSFILVQKPYMERRTYATFRKQWPEATCVVTSPNIAYEDFAKSWHYTDRWIDVMVGDLQRIKDYPALGFQTEQEIPPEVLAAYERLVAQGYTKYIL
ncbi:MAG: YdcF family protein [Patescibacteria group bacterium]